MVQLTHLDAAGAAHMVDVSAKAVTTREAVAGAEIAMLPATLELIASAGHKKGDVLAVARIAGIQAAKRCSELIPLCHQLMLSKVDVQFELDTERSVVKIRARCKLAGQTGVEMEALTAASIAALTIYDMCKGVDRAMVISALQLDHKSGGKSGDYNRSDSDRESDRESGDA